MSRNTAVLAPYYPSHGYARNIGNLVGALRDLLRGIHEMTHSWPQTMKRINKFDVQVRRNTLDGLEIGLVVAKGESSLLLRLTDASFCRSLQLTRTEPSQEAHLSPLSGINSTHSIIETIQGKAPACDTGRLATAIGFQLLDAAELFGD